MRLNLNTTTPDEAALEAALHKLETEDLGNRSDAISDDRRKSHCENRRLGTEALIAKLKTNIPQAIQHAKIVGSWVWVTFPGKPEAAVRDKLYDLGFHWNRKRGAWQNPCSAFSGHSKSDPLERYPVAAITSAMPEETKSAVIEQPAPVKMPRFMQLRKAVAV